MSKDFEILVKTSDRNYAGTDSNVYIQLHDVNGNKSEPIALKTFFRNNFERNKLDDFAVITENGLQDIAFIEVWRDNSGLGSLWHLEYIQVNDFDKKREFVFPYHRWVTAERHHLIDLYDTCLPQNDQHWKERQEELTQRKGLYEYDELDPMLPVCVRELCDDDKYSTEFKVNMVKTRISLLSEFLVVKFINDMGNFQTWEEVFNLYDQFPGMRTPLNIKRWREDSYFGKQRLNGCNPKMIKLCTAVPENFKLDEKIVAEFLEGTTLRDAIAQMKIYIVDLTLLDGIEKTDEERHVPAPYCLFYLNRENDLMPVAIQLEKKPGPNNPVFYPNDDAGLWTFVKMWFNLADAQYMASSIHLGTTHFYMEGFCVCTNRNLSPSHPVYKLLAPHFLNLLPINALGVKLQLEPDEIMDRIFNMGRLGAVDMVKRTYTNYDVNKSDFMNDLKLRGVDNENILPHYHYRDDAKLIYKAIGEYITDIVHLYYKTEQDIVEDVEIQNWGADMIAPKLNGLGLKGIPADGRFTKYVEIIQIVRYIIFTCSVDHTAINFTQYDQLAFPPSYPASLRGKPPSSKDQRITEEDILENYLSNKNLAFEGMVFFKVLTEQNSKSLGDYEVQYFHDPEAVRIVKKFQAELLQIGDTINKREEEREYRYPFLHPAVIPNSISN